MYPHQVAPIAINGLFRGKRIIIPGVDEPDYDPV